MNNNVQNALRAFFQTLGKSLMLPVAALPVAGLMLGLGQEQALGQVNELLATLMASAGGAIFDNLPLIFALGVAIGFAKDSHGSAALAALVGYFTFQSGLKIYNSQLIAGAGGDGLLDPTQLLNTGVLGGIIIGLLAGALYNRFYNIKVPTVLAFFGGKRFVPIITGFAALLLSMLFWVIWPPIQEALKNFGNWLIASGGIGLFLYGFFNRMLIPLGLHHVLNTIVWFQFGQFIKPDGQVVFGDLHRFAAGDPTAGAFMSGFFPIMMFGLIGASLAFFITAKKARKPEVIGVLISMALTSFLTGITEPLEFTFMFIAMPLYVVHAILTGLSLALMNLLGVKLGFSFSAGLIDYLIYFPLATKPLLLIPVGLVFFALYFGLFSLSIKLLNLKTLGREDQSNSKAPKVSENTQAAAYLAALGGSTNILSIDACATRLRLEVRDSSLVDSQAIKSLGAFGVIKKENSHSIQVVIGPSVDLLLNDLRTLI